MARGPTLERPLTEISQTKSGRFTMGAVVVFCIHDKNFAVKSWKAAPS